MLSELALAVNCVPIVEPSGTTSIAGHANLELRETTGGR
jgi:hypothetical protein